MRELLLALKKSEQLDKQRHSEHLTDFMLSIASVEQANKTYTDILDINNTYPDPLDILIAVEDEFEYTEWDYS